MSDTPERVAEGIFVAAVRQKRCAALLDCLHHGGAATIDQGVLTLISAEQVRAMSGMPLPAFDDAVLYCAALSDESQMELEDARRFWERLGTYALDTAAEMTT